MDFTDIKDVMDGMKRFDIFKTLLGVLFLINMIRIYSFRYLNLYKGLGI